MRSRFRLLAAVGLLALVLVSAATAGAYSRGRPAGVVGFVRFCGGPRLRGRPLCRHDERGGQIVVRSHGRLMTVAPMSHGSFSIVLHPGRYGLVAVLKHGGNHSRSTPVRVVAHRTTRVRITFQLK